MEKRISISCLLGFILSCLGLAVIPVPYVIGIGFGLMLVFMYIVPFYICVIITEFIAQILSIAGVITASKKHLKLRRLGVAGIVISTTFLTIIVLTYLFCFSHIESPQVAATVSGIVR